MYDFNNYDHSTITTWST